MNTHDLVEESNRIEGIFRPPTEAEIREHERFVRLENLSISELQSFVRIFQPNARLRIFPGMDVQVGSYVPPKGGEHIVAQLQALISEINSERVSCWDAHIQYERLHPFSDCNGRSGRAIWHFSIKKTPLVSYGFLHAFYYQTLKKCASNEAR